MKNLLKRVLSIAAATALLMTSVISASAADPGHSHGGGTEISDKSGPYTITLSHPDGKTTFGADSHYGAYQIFSGTVPKVGDESYEKPETNLGDTNQRLPITDIKWGNAFCNSSDSDLNPTNDTYGQENILKFIYALYSAPSGSYSYAFSDFNDFKDFITVDTGSSTIKLNSAYVTSSNVIFTVDDDGKVTKIDNPENVNYDKLAVEVADIIAGKTDREWLQKFNDILGGFGQGKDGAYANLGYVNRFYEGAPNSDDNKKYDIKVPAGYYMVREMSGFTGADKSYSARMLFVANDIEQKLKESVPVLHKYVVRDGGDLKETEAAGVGDEVDFRLTGTLPSNYDLYVGGYQYKFTDTLSKGLTLKGTNDATYPFNYGEASGTDFVVKVKGVYKKVKETTTWEAGTELTIQLASVTTGSHAHATASQAYTAQVTNSDDKQTLTVTFPCLKEILITGDGTNGESDATYTLGVYHDGDDIEKSEIYIEYTAVVNENAVVSPKGADGVMNGNTNKATLTYSDNPQSYGDTDTTTSDNATVYTFGLDIVKVDAAEFLRKGETAAALDNAKFVIVRPNPTDGTKYQIAKLEKFEKEASPADPPTPRSYEDTYYSIDVWSDLTSTETDLQKKIADFLKGEDITKEDYEVATADGGKLLISGLNDDVTYTMVETATPGDNEYAMIDPFTITLEAAKNGDEYTGKLKSATSEQSVKSGKSFSYDRPVEITDKFGADDNGSANMLVANFKYTDLPSTGGIGVYIYYIAGGCAVVLALVLFALSKKKRSDK